MINYKFAKKVSKILIKLLKIFRPDAGTSLPGHVMLKMYPEYLKNQNENIKELSVVVTGTNGKTTTSGLLASILNESGKSVLHNKKGANMPQGIATSFLHNDEKPIDYCVLECDEAWLSTLLKSIKSQYLVVTNIFPDQTERYGGVYALAKKIRYAIDKNPDMKIILNADDPHLLSLVNENTVCFGVENVENSIEEYKYMPEICTCGAEYKYKKHYYAHLGKYKCKLCGNKNPEVKYRAKVVLSMEKSEITINDENTFTTSLIGFYNAYNLICAVSTALELGIDNETIQKGLDNYQNVFGRADKFTINNKNVIVQLIKNPAGANQAIKLIKDIEESKLLIAINDTPADGIDISWLYDTDFEYLKDYRNEIIISGSRANEVALRLKHAGLSEKQFYIEEDIKRAYRHAIRGISTDENLLVLANFSALAGLKKIMKR